MTDDLLPAVALAAIFGPPRRRLEVAAADLGVTPQVLRQAAETALEPLPLTQRVVLLRRYGITTPFATLQMLAAEMRISRERVRQLERAAFERLRYIPRPAGSRN